MNHSTGPGTKIVKYTSFAAEIPLGIPSGSDAKSYPRGFLATGGDLALRQADGTTVIIPQALLGSLLPLCGATAILTSGGGTSASAVCVLY